MPRNLANAEVVRRAIQQLEYVEASIQVVRLSAHQLFLLTERRSYNRKLLLAELECQGAISFIAGVPKFVIARTIIAARARVDIQLARTARTMQTTGGNSG
jgi:hypothetical protein